MALTSSMQPGDWDPAMLVDGDRYVGLLDGESVYVGTVAGARREVDQNNPIFLLPLLEKEFSAVDNQLRKAGKSVKGDELYYVDRIPLRQLPSAAIRMQNDYWVGLAIDWIEQIGAVSFVGVLETVVAAPWTSQSLRHRARHVLKAART